MRALLLAACAFMLGACAENTPPAEEVREHFERGLSGQGHIVPLDRPGDPALPPPEEQPTPADR